MSVAALLTNKPEKLMTTQASVPVLDAAKIMADNMIGALVVTENGDKVAGIISERDIVRGLSARGASILTSPVADLMTAPVKTCTRSDSVDDVMRWMTEGRFRHMPVVEGEKLVGVISIGDVVKNRMNALEHEAGAMRDYIMTG